MTNLILTLIHSKNSLVNSLLVSVLMLFLVECTKKEEQTVVLDVVADKTISSNSPQIIPVLNAKTYPSHIIEGQMAFDWEHVDKMPTAPGDIEIPAPWSDQARRHFSEDIRYDFKNSDGWELYNSSFTTSYRTAHHYFVLYNKYRGVLRQYIYVDQGVTSAIKDYSVLANKLQTNLSYSPESPVLNFADQQIIDFDKNSTFVSSISPQPLTNSTWYVAECELAFDKEIYQQSFSNFFLSWAFQMIKPLALSINSNTTLDAEIRKQGVDFISFENSVESSEANVILKGPSDIAKLAGTLMPTDVSLINQSIDHPSDDQLLSSSSQNDGSTELSWNVQLTFNRDQSAVGITYLYYGIGGADNSAQPGPGNFYTQALGVFYLNQKPVVKYTKSGSSPYLYKYQLDATSIQYIFNLTVSNLATIEHIRQELVATKEEKLLENLTRSKLYTGQTLSSNLPLFIQGVRVSFDVVPKDGSSKVHIVKTFRATIKEN